MVDADQSRVGLVWRRNCRVPKIEPQFEPPMDHLAHRQEKTSESHAGMNHYPRLYAMTGLSFAAMYVLMYAMVDVFANVFNSLNQVYMAGLMAAAMVIIELVVMGRMYHDRRRNIGLIAGSIAVLLLCWFGIRQQWGIGNRQFLRSMIPHHAGAILMCEQASVDDVEIRALCQGIIAGQQSEIDQMKARLDALR